MNVNKININQQETSYYIASDIYDVSYHNSGTSFESLSALLSSENLSTLIPTEIRCGGMTIRFIQTSDNKYVQYRLMSNEFTKDITQWAIDDESVYVENPEFVYVKTDGEDKILWAIKIDGGIYYGAGVPQQVKDYIEEKVAELSLDEYEGIIAFLNGLWEGDKTLQTLLNEKVDKEELQTLLNEKVDKEEGKSLIEDEVKECFNVIENEEYLAVEQDVEGKVLSSTNADGSHYIHNVKSETIPTEFEHIEDIEGRTEITTDAEDKILGFRDSKGTRHEHKISAKHLELSNEAAKEVNEAFKSAGIKMENPSDFSKDSYIELPIPIIAAQVRLYAPKLPTTKQDDIEAEIEYNDKDGNYFRKQVILNAQGSSSMGYYVKNMAIDIADGSEIKFGDFPTQDSFHLKKYYIDVFRGQCIVGYWLMEQVYKSHLVGKQYPYEYNYSNNSVTDGFGDVKKDFFTGAKCHPDGFPIIITWINSKTGEETWMGIYTWNLKKSKEVYACNKKNAENIILDGVIGKATLFGGVVDWTAFEIRNPKPLKDIDGNKYDGDNPKELSDTDANSKKVKDYLTTLSGVYSALQSSKTKETFEKYFLPNPFIDYQLLSQMIYNFDGFSKNWIWVTYDGIHWTPTAYDLDSIFGAHWQGTCVDPKSATKDLSTWNGLSIDTLYKTEIEERYKELRDKNIFSVDNIVGLLNKWLSMVGFDNIEKEISLYKETPSYRSSSVAEGWKLAAQESYGVADFNIDKEYHQGDKCVYDVYVFEATKTITSVVPVEKQYTNYPYYLGFHNSVIRVKNWLTQRIEFLDNLYNYNKNNK